MIVVEIRDMIDAVGADRPLWPSFRDAAHTAAVVDAVLESNRDKSWKTVRAEPEE
jgi:predicted dehydrogenase